jgi:hypothetical protein
MRSNSMSRLGRASAAIAVGVVAVAGVASTANAQNWNGYNGGYYTNAPYNSPSSNRGWTWGERYGAPPNTYYQAPGYYAPQQGYYSQQNSYPTYGPNPNAALGQLQGLFVR